MNKYLIGLIILITNLFSQSDYKNEIRSDFQKYSQIFKAKDYKQLPKHFDDFDYKKYISKREKEFNKKNIESFRIVHIGEINRLDGFNIARLNAKIKLSLEIPPPSDNLSTSDLISRAEDILAWLEYENETAWKKYSNQYKKNSISKKYEMTINRSVFAVKNEKIKEWRFIELSNFKEIDEFIIKPIK